VKAINGKGMAGVSRKEVDMLPKMQKPSVQKGCLDKG